ncbi:MAG TPA: 2,3-bisphosphoglycerate-independent phosphoglycerate mutase [Candidatus Methanoperedenaceae archaeon]|nr:2,3-bisphosphoglycerate-independent phosphoglycerate mutase [Candidatus Methanoperedenaceae archaeon]
MQRPVALIILDGFGLREKTEGNAVSAARTPNLDRFYREYPWTTLVASGEAVGLPEGQMGNSEVGHLNIGAGRIVYQDLTRITKSIRDRSLFSNAVLREALMLAKQHGSAVHLMGLLSDGGVHSHIDHLKALLELSKLNGIDRVYVHAFLDGRDVPPRSAAVYVREIEAFTEKLGIGKIATVCGRYYAMDRDKRWDRVKKAYDALTSGDGMHAASASDAVEAAYARGESDEFVQPTAIAENGFPGGAVTDNDTVVFFNFRSDRAREITRAMTAAGFSDFERKRHPKVHFVCLCQYDETFRLPVAFPPEHHANILGEVLGKNGMMQLRIAETEKYAHVTFFFNGGEETPFAGEERCLIPSPKVATYDLKPEMSAYELTDETLERIRSHTYDVIILNYANCDMVGHTGIFEAAVAAVEAVDECLGKVVEAVRQAGGISIITADHGNAEMMTDEDGKPHTAHTCSRVPFILIDDGTKNLRSGILADIAPTILELLDIRKPAEMTGRSLLQ